MAAEQGHLFGTTEPCVARPNATGIPSTVSQALAERPRCMISFGNVELDTASFVMYLTSLAVFLQVPWAAEKQ